MDFIIEWLNLRHRPSDISEKLKELGFKESADEKWEKGEKGQITVVEHNRKLNGDEIYTLRISAFNHPYNKEEICRIYEQLERAYKPLKIEE